MPTISVEIHGRVAVVTIERPQVRNAVDGPTAQALYDAFRTFDADPDLDVAVLQGRDGAFCAGADLKGVAEGRGNPVRSDGDLGPMGCTRLALSKPVIAAIEGHAVAGGLEVACWCDLRIAAEDAVFGVFCRRWGVPLIDLGTVRLAMGLANRVVPRGQALAAALELAAQLSAFPQTCLRNDRASALAQWSLDWDAATRQETVLGRQTLASGESQSGAARFASGAGRHGAF
jgi:enoyl-CoA hydratase